MLAAVVEQDTASKEQSAVKETHDNISPDISPSGDKEQTLEATESPNVRHLDLAVPAERLDQAQSSEKLRPAIQERARQSPSPEKL